jgi:hypothetical protein
MTTASPFQELLERVEALSAEDKSALLEVLQKRAIAARRSEMASEISEARADYADGKVSRGSAADAIKALAS